MAPRPDVSDDRKKEILDAAARVFSRKGFGSARVDDIAEESGVSKGLLYWYFKGKDELIVALLRRLLAPEARRLKELPARTGSAARRLRLLTDQVVKEIAIISRFLPITFEYYSLAFRNRRVGEVMKGFFHVYTDNIQRVIEQGIERGEFRAVDPRRAALAYGATVEGTLLLWVFDRDTVQVETQLREGADIFIRGISKGKATPANPAGGG